jgi:hypothetical protein
VCLSKQAYDEFSDDNDFPLVVMMTDMGDHQLKGIAEPMRIVSVLPAELSDRKFPPVIEMSCDRCKTPLSCPKCDEGKGQKRKKSGFSITPGRAPATARRRETVSSKYSYHSARIVSPINNYKKSATCESTDMEDSSTA